VSCIATGPHARDLLRRFWLEMLLACVLGIGIIARVFQEVVEHARLDAERQRFRAVLDEATDAIRIVDTDTQKILDCNRRDAEISGHAREALIGQDARAFWPVEPPPRDEVETPGASDHRDGVVRVFGQPYRRRSGDTIRVDAIRRFVEHSGRRYEILIYRESAEREAREASERDAAELRAVALLAAAAAHEINNPLAIVMGSNDLLARRLTPESPEARLVDQARNGVLRIRDIVLRMSHITRVVATPAHGHLPPILDIAQSTAVPEQEVS
jgi:PAS domain S-box-containing protein